MSAPRILFIGDSLTAGLFASSDAADFRCLVTARFSATQIQVASTGAKSEDFLISEAAIIAAAADVLILELGTNDEIHTGDTPATLVANLQTLIGWARTGNPNCKVIVLSTWRGTGEYPTWDAAIEAVVESLGSCAQYIPLQTIYDVGAFHGPANVVTTWAGITLDATNECVYPNFALDTNADGLADGWGIAQALPVPSIVAGRRPGTFAQRLTFNGTDVDHYQTRILLNGLSPGDVKTFSAYIRANDIVDADTGPFISAEDQVGAPVYALVAGYGAKGTTDWVRYSATVTISQGADHCYFFLRRNGGGGHVISGSVDYCDFQIEDGPVATPYLDGGMGTGYAWTGPANASASTRTGVYFTDDYHPNDLGHAAIAAAVIPAVIRALSMPHIHHDFVSAKADGSDDTQVQPSAWDAPHVIDDKAIPTDKLDLGTNTALVGAAGAGAALPATPEGYIEVGDFLVPYYAKHVADSG